MESTEADAKVSPLLRMIAHDLKGLLGTPGLLIHLAQEARDEDELKERLAALSEAFKAIDRVATDVGDLGYAVGETSTLGTQPVDLCGLLQNVLTIARSAGAQRNIELVGELTPGPWPPVTGEAMLLTRTLERLVYWAIAHAPSGSKVVIAAGPVDGTIRVRVPAGREAPGAIPTIRERLIEIEPGAKELGVALPLARDVLERHGGSLTVAKDGALEARIPTEN